MLALRRELPTSPYGKKPHSFEPRSADSQRNKTALARGLHWIGYFEQPGDDNAVSAFSRHVNRGRSHCRQMAAHRPMGISACVLSVCLLPVYLLLLPEVRFVYTDIVILLIDLGWIGTLILLPLCILLLADVFKRRKALPEIA
jgi:hypothetical protein